MSLSALNQLLVSRHTPFRVFVGYDARRPVVYHVLCHSILTHASIPVTIAPIEHRTLRMFTRPRGKTQVSDRSYTRFFVPFLSGYRGVSLYLDGDMLCQGDVAELCHLALSSTKAVHVCAQPPVGDAPPVTAPQGSARSAVMLFLNDACARLTPGYVDTAPVHELHGLAWLEGHEIGEVPTDWHWRVGPHLPNPQAKTLHWDTGGPWTHADARHADRWHAARAAMLGSPAPCPTRPGQGMVTDG